MLGYSEPSSLLSWLIRYLITVSDRPKTEATQPDSELHILSHDSPTQAQHSAEPKRVDPRVFICRMPNRKKCVMPLSLQGTQRSHLLRH